MIRGQDAAGFAFKSFAKLWHVGSMNPRIKRPGSYEGAGLSVSVHPEDWQQIAEIGGDLWELTKREQVREFPPSHEGAARDCRTVGYPEWLRSLCRSGEPHGTTTSVKRMSTLTSSQKKKLLLRVQK